MNKYHAKKGFYDGKKFDSKKEAKRARELNLLLKAGVIRDLQTQVKFELQGKFRLNGKAVRAINYIADFVYSKDGKIVIEDTKGYKTKEYNLKKKMLLRLIYERKIDGEFVES